MKLEKTKAQYKAIAQTILKYHQGETNLGEGIDLIDANLIDVEQDDGPWFIRTPFEMIEIQDADNLAQYLEAEEGRLS